METYQVVNCPTNELSYTNRAILNPSALLAGFEHIAIRFPKKGQKEYEAFVFSTRTDRAVEPGKIAFNASGRKWASLMTNSVIEAAPYKFIPQSQCLNSITFTVDFMNRSTAPKDISLDTAAMSKQFIDQFSNQAFTVGQIFGFVYKQNSKIVLELKVKELAAVNTDDGTQPVEIGLTTANTVAMFESAEGSSVSLTGDMTSTHAAPKIFNHNWDFASMGIGGLSEQFNKMFVRAFATRLLPPQVAQDIGLDHVRGILLYGPPGTGKTLIARQIGNMLLAREPKVVNGPELLSKFVGESEANVRKLFADAEEEQAKKGIDSGLHLIIFDEIDSLCKARGSSASSSGVGDQVVNQLLSKIDGVNALNNVLIIGMTNRRELIDEALLRPGRLELQIEIGLPNEEGRHEILRIHTRKMQEAGALDPSVDLMDVARMTKNFTGAELKGLVTAAQSLAVNRVVKPGENVGRSAKETKSLIKVTQDDFILLLKHHIKPALGASEDQLKDLARQIIQWDPAIGVLQTRMSFTIKQLSSREVEEDRPFFLLLIGAPWAGSTTLAANMAAETNFPFIRIHRCGSMAGKSETAKIQYLEKLFEDASRSELSCLVLDGLEVLFDYCHIGPRWLNSTYARFLDFKDISLPKNHRMLVICTCKSKRAALDLSFKEYFDQTFTIPSLTNADQVRTVLENLAESGNETFSEQLRHELVEALKTIPFKLGIKKLERLIKNATQDDETDRVRMFLQRMHELGAVEKPSASNLPFEF